jgi:predicted dinucleotide-binding enzyme
MKAAILGSGKVASAIAHHLFRQQHRVAFGVRNLGAESVAQALAACTGATAAPAAQAVEDADLVFVALPWAAVSQTLPPLASALAGKTVVDCTNAYEVAHGCVKPVAFPSAAQVLQGYLPEARVVKAFNQLGAAKLAHPLFADGKPWMGIAGDDHSSVQQVADLARSFGFNAVPFGKLTAALHLEDMARIWIHGAYVAGLGPGIGFALLRG